MVALATPTPPPPPPYRASRERVGVRVPANGRPPHPTLSPGGGEGTLVVARRRRSASLRLPERKPWRSTVTCRKPNSPSPAAVAPPPPGGPRPARPRRGGRSRR